MIYTFSLEDVCKGNKLLANILEDKRVLANSVIYLLEEHFPDLSVVYSSNLTLLKDTEDNVYKVFTSGSGVFDVSQSCTRGVGRDSSFGDWKKFVDDNGFNRIMLVNTSNKGVIQFKIYNVGEVVGIVKF